MEDRINRLEKQLSEFEEREGNGIVRVKGELKLAKKQKGKCYSSRIVSVPHGYYSLKLEQRAKVSAPIHQATLCLFLNTLHSHHTIFVSYMRYI